jgi:CRP/FNR family transcriptional regulator, cyclic AMP receptor protein
MEHEAIKEHLSKLRSEMIFSLIEDNDIEKIISFFDLVTYPVKSVVFKEGDPGDFIGFVVSGKLEVKKQTEFKGNQVIIALLGSGALVGELSIFDQHKRSATVEAVENTTLLILRNKSLDALIQQHPYTGIKLLKGLIRILSLRLRKATERLTTIF